MSNFILRLNPYFILKYQRRSKNGFQDQVRTQIKSSEPETIDHHWKEGDNGRSCKGAQDLTKWLLRYLFLI